MKEESAASSHLQGMSDLEKRAQKYHNRGISEQGPDDLLYDEAIDETGTVATAALTDSDCESESSAEEMSVQQFLESGICEDLLKIHGTAPGRKAEGVTRVGMENMNGLPNHINGNEKRGKSKEQSARKPRHSSSCKSEGGRPVAKGR